MRNQLICNYMVSNTGPLALVECSSIVQQTGVQYRSIHTKDSKMVLDATLLRTQHYKVRIEGKVEQYREWSSALPYTSV